MKHYQKTEEAKLQINSTLSYRISDEKEKDDEFTFKQDAEQVGSISPVVSSFQEICAMLSNLPESPQRTNLVEKTRDLLNRYQNAIGDISRLEQESDRQTQRIKIESAFNNRLVLLQQEVLNADQQHRDRVNSIEQLKTLNEQLQTMLLAKEDSPKMHHLSSFSNRQHP